MTPRTVRRRALDIVLIVIAAVALIAMSRTMPGYDQKTAPMRVRGRIGEVVSGRSFALRVRGVELAKTISAAALLRGTVTRTTSGVWVIVDAGVQALREPMMLGTAALRTREGLLYAAVDDRMRGRELLMNQTTQPGVAHRGVLLFELPPEQLAGVVLEAAERPLDTPLDSRLEIDLGIDDAQAKRLLSQAQAEYHLAAPGEKRP